MNVCSMCGGFVRIDMPRKVIDNKVYHYHCGGKKEDQILKDKKESEKIATPHKS